MRHPLLRLLVHQAAQSDHQDVLAHVSAKLRLEVLLGFVAELARLVALNLVKEALRLPNLHLHRLLDAIPGRAQHATERAGGGDHLLSVRLDRAQRKVGKGLLVRVENGERFLAGNGARIVKLPLVRPRHGARWVSRR